MTRLDPPQAQTSMFVETHTVDPRPDMAWYSETISKLNTETEPAAEAIERSGANANQEWITEALKVVRELCLTRPEFSTDELWSVMDTLDVSTHDPRAAGSVMRTAAECGWCQNTQRVVKSTRKKCHRRPVAVWQSLIFSPSA